MQNAAGLGNVVHLSRKRKYIDWICTNLSESSCYYFGQVIYYIEITPLHPKEKQIPCSVAILWRHLILLTRTCQIKRKKKDAFVSNCRRSAHKSASETRVPINFTSSTVDLNDTFKNLLRSRKKASTPSVNLPKPIRRTWVIPCNLIHEELVSAKVHHNNVKFW